MTVEEKSPAAIAEELGERLKQARLNADMTQVEVAEQAGISRKAVLNAEKGKVQLEILIAIMGALRLTGQLTIFFLSRKYPLFNWLNCRGANVIALPGKGRRRCRNHLNGKTGH